MFLQQAYRQNKWLFALFLGFLLLQTAVLVTRIVKVSPCYIYGMFSQVYKPVDTVKLISVELDGIELRPQDFTPHQWDNIANPAEAILSYRSTIERYGRLGSKILGTDTSRYRNPLSTAQMWEYYVQRLPYLAGQYDAQHAKVWHTSYIWRDKPIRVHQELLYEK